ncbi:NEDD8-activating enzyme E1 catalytic subunit [Sphaeramia orbicularis]|uniref:NEDD8-activating enzyme E1 catalytic subunit n=1 Tax=Sphaeramia orbicularis TaxID=375764 RepID=UPI0011805D50|nr:NEDD8-activating enzyme E1 catalytic subunit-like [Sphaeramia orbicularis]
MLGLWHIVYICKELFFFARKGFFFFYIAACATEVFKIASSTSLSLNNYMIFKVVDSVYTYAFQAEQKENCSACSQVPVELHFSPSSKLHEVLNYLAESASLQMKSPVVTAMVDGRNKILYLQSGTSVKQRKHPNLYKTLKDLGLTNRQKLVVVDVTTPQTMLFQLCFTS